MREVRRRAHRALVALLGTLALLPRIALAQAVQGRVTDLTTQRPIVGALVELRAAATVIASTLTTPSGTFLISAPKPGSYDLRVAAIGYAPPPSLRLNLEARGVMLPEFALRRVTISLPELVVIGGQRGCRRTGLSDDTFGRLLESARTSLQVIEATIRSGEVGFEVEIVTTNTMFGNVRNYHTADTTYESFARWPVQSLEPDSLRRIGFSRHYWTAKTGEGRIYYGPDPRVLFADWFLAGHCFTLDRVSAQSDSLRIRFVPRGNNKLVDISGTFVLDRTTLALLNLTFTHQRLPAGLSEGSAGGELEFERLGSGLWITRDWAIWGPIERLRDDGGPPGMVGIVEVRGWVRRVVPGRVPGPN